MEIRTQAKTHACKEHAREITHPAHTPVTPHMSQEIKDVNGAGDSFVGGFMAALIQVTQLTTATTTI